MSKFTCLVTCAAAAVSLISVYAVEMQSKNDPSDSFEALINECTSRNGVTIAELNEAVNKGDVSGISPCFWGCGFKKAGFLNDQGQYDLDSGLAHIKKFISDDPEGYQRIEKITRQCESVKNEAVNDGKAGCEMGTLAANCFLEQFKLMKTRLV